MASLKSNVAASSDIENRRLLSDLEGAAYSVCERGGAPCFKVPVEIERTIVTVDGQSANAIKSVVFPDAQVCNLPINHLERIQDAYFNMPSLCVQRYVYRLIVSAHTDKALPNLSDNYFDSVSPDFLDRYREYDVSLWNMQSAHSRKDECGGYCKTVQVRRRGQMIAEILFVQVER